MSINKINGNISPDLLFTKEPTVIKSDWKYSIWNRKQLRIKVTSSGELAVQTVAQNTLARLASKLLKFFSCNFLKSIGKRVESFTFAGYVLPADLSVPLSAQKQKDLMEIQSQQLALGFLPAHKRLSNLGSELIEMALQDPEKCGQAVRQKILNMCQEILDFQLSCTEELQKDLSPAELYAISQKHEKQAEIFCKEFPIALKDFIEKNQEIKEIQTPEIEDFSKEKFLELFTLAKARIADLKDRLQLSAADWLERGIEKIIEKDLPLKLAIESLEDALDCVEDDAKFAEQLRVLPIDSPYEQQLKNLVISEIRETLVNFGKTIDAKEKEIERLSQSSTTTPWQEDIVGFFETTRQKAKMLAENHNSFESWIPGYEIAMRWLNDSNPLINLEALDRHRLIKHQINVEHFCSNTLSYIEEEIVQEAEKINSSI